MFFYRSFEDLAALIRQEYQSYSRFDLIIGIPRSGLMPANLIALYLNKPLSTPELLINGKLLSGGFRIEDEQVRLQQTKSKLRALVIDDSCTSGKQLQQTRMILKALQEDYIFEYLAVYVDINSKRLVNHHLEVVPLPRLFEWNILNHMMLQNSCVDIDGVLCPDPTDRENDDGKEYLEFILNAPCLIRPKYKIHSLVTSRLDKYRTPTERWLEKNDIKYDNLIMSPHDSAESRRAAGDHAKLKAEYYKSLDTRLFIESDLKQAQSIFELSKKPVYCVDHRVYFNPLDAEKMLLYEKERNRQMKRSPINIAYTMLKESIKRAIKYKTLQ